MVSARFGADGMSLLLLPGEAECRSPPKGLQRRITTPGLKQLQGPKASVSGTNWSHPMYKSTSYGESYILGFQSAMGLSNDPRLCYSD